MSRILLVAARDYRQIVATRGFKILLMIVPLMIGIFVVTTQYLRPPPTVAYILVDAGGKTAPVIDHRLELDYQGDLLRDLSNYARRWNLAAPGDENGDDAAVEKFMAQGGVAGALRRMRPPPEIPAFKPATRPYLRVAPPPGVPVGDGAAFGRAIAPWLEGDIQTPEGKRPLAMAAWFPASGPAQVWTNGRPNDELVGAIRYEQTRLARLAALEAGGLDAATAARIQGLEAPLLVTTPPAGGGRDRMLARSAVPLVLVYLLLMVTLITGGMMLQSVIEERSNKLLEAVLACIEPRELMLGKLMGLGAIGLTILAAWIGCAVVAVFAFQSVIADYARPSLSSMAEPWMLAVMLFYFFSGYLILAMIYLTIGSVSNSMQDAQASLMPLTMAVLIPVMLLLSTTVRNPGGWLPQVMSWIPIYTPFAMLARLGQGVPAWEIIGTGLLLIAFMALEVVLLGRVFRASILNGGQPPRLREFLRLIVRGE